MSWVTVIFSMTASTSLTLALIYGFMWWRQRDAWPQLLFALVAFGTATLAWFNLSGLLAQSTTQFNSAVRWTHLSVWVVFLALAGFVRVYLRAGRTWLLCIACGLRTVSLLINFITGQNLNYREISSLRHLPFLGETVSAVEHGVRNLWMFVGQLSLWVLMIFVADAAITVWRRGDRRLAVRVGGTIALFLFAGAGRMALIALGYAQWPSAPSLFFLGIVMIVGYELGHEALRAAQLARELRASEQRVTLATKMTNLGFWFWDFTHGEICASDQCRALFGFTKFGRLHIDDVLQRLHPDDREITRQLLANKNPSSASHQAEQRVLLPDGQTRWIASEGSVELDLRGRPVRVQGVSLDITQRKQAELEAQAHRREIAHLLRVASLGELSSALAHELSQPLAAIMSNAQAAELFLNRDELDLTEIRQILRDIVTDDKRAGEIIVRLRALLKKGELQPRALDVNELVRDVLKLMHYEFISRCVRPATEFGADLPSIRGDHVELQQVIINLILNACDAMSQTAENARTLTLRSSRVEGNLIRISVEDTGVGVPPGAEEIIFESYHTTKPGGLGLGLSLSRSIVRAHGGQLWAESQIARGAIFHFTVPEWKDDRQ
jgi:two-component system sensor kinase FixL